MADQTSYIPHEAEEAPLLHEMESLQPVPLSITNLSSSLRIQQDQASLVHQDSLEIPRFGNLAYLSIWMIPKLDLGWWSKRTNLLVVQQVVATVIFGMNLCWTIWARTRYETLDGIGTIYLGNCTSVKRINLWLHLFINALSTLLLGSSNYCMQLLVAPTHSEVQKAHKNSEWLDIGAPSVRNLQWIARRSVFVWCCLGLSSALLHLFWNSAIFPSIPIYKYTAAFTTNDYLQHNESWSDDYLDRIRLNITEFERLDNTECIERYVNPLNNGKDVVVVTNKSSSANDGKAFLGSYHLEEWPYEGLWICASPDIGSRLGDGGCTSDFMKPFSDNWTVVYKNKPYYNKSDSRESVPALYCLSAGVHSKDQGCGIHFSVPIMIFVCILNIIKCVSICWTAYYNWTAQPFSTVGDAQAFYLRNPDIHTKGISSASRHDFPQGGPWSSEPRIWKPQKLRWYRAASRRRWIFVLILCTTSLVTVIFLLSEAIAERKRDLAPTDLVSLWKEGLGAMNAHELIGRGFSGSATETLLKSVLLANSPQLLFSFLYYLYNGLLTCMLVAEEQSHHGAARKSLRVSAPLDYQRSSWFLSLPYRYSVPLTICFGLQHWFISQAMFFVRTLMYSQEGIAEYANGGSRVGFSPIGIILAFTLVSIPVVALAAIGFINKYPGGERAVPLISTCSAAISAACHAPEDDKDAHALPVRWGVVSSHDGIGHCSFTTARDVGPPLEGTLYK